MENINRRDFFKKGAIATAAGATLGMSCDTDVKKGNSESAIYSENHPMKDGLHSRNFNQSYHGPFLNKVAFPLGGIGAGMVCLEGSGCISHVSVRNTPEIFKEPFMFAAISIKGNKN
ncbi:MAG: twin-arginine translocation signal domain-containing protein, partial [Cyclobacteriaceae bacterium]|nr:twin-arginine translocation signal domain-containing protein [Cyclobacteriaceae bacterium]